MKARIRIQMSNAEGAEKTRGAEENGPTPLASLVDLDR